MAEHYEIIGVCRECLQPTLVQGFEDVPTNDGRLVPHALGLPTCTNPDCLLADTQGWTKVGMARAQRG